MNKIYMVILNFDNGEYYEDNYWYTEVERIFSTEEKALNYIRNWTILENEREEGYTPKYNERPDLINTKVKSVWSRCERVIEVLNICNPGYYSLEIQEMEID